MTFYKLVKRKKSYVMYNFKAEIARPMVHFNIGNGKIACTPPHWHSKVQSIPNGERIYG